MQKGTSFLSSLLQHYYTITISQVPFSGSGFFLYSTPYLLRVAQELAVSRPALAAYYSPHLPSNSLGVWLIDCPDWKAATCNLRLAPPATHHHHYHGHHHRKPTPPEQNNHRTPPTSSKLLSRPIVSPLFCGWYNLHNVVPSLADILRRLAFSGLLSSAGLFLAPSQVSAVSFHFKPLPTPDRPTDVDSTGYAPSPSASIQSTAISALHCSASRPAPS
ncbi:hypothetical protein CPLU01_09083 [Colletotrichum plurivorum]|uniref:Uncharacterized protein n=1 Tax=Colletotrichum plurivorum TaxID=2175906 RepID=A0A8H6K9R8_9PEZI|nr:hypothetical protein CPLU01_09083 [Colletotrichum plurivorum]